MVLNKKIKVEVVYAQPQQQKIIELEVEAESDIQHVIQSSKILSLFPEIDLTKHRVGIFSKLKKLTDVVEEGDRVEIYRPLIIDPKEARRKRQSA